MSRTVVINNKFIPSDFLPIGFLGYVPYSQVPAGWLVSDGTVYNIADYPELAVKLGNAYGGDGVTTFAVPDERGLFRRGLDLGKGYDAGRAIGSEQVDGFASHYHVSGAMINASTYPYGYIGNAPSSQSLKAPNVTFANDTYSPTTNSTGGTETRPQNRAFLPIIKAKNIYYDMTIQGGNAASLGGNPATYYAANSLAVKYTDFTGSFATNGYRRLPDGLIIQWGQATITTGTSIMFPVAFTSACYSFTMTPIGSNAYLLTSSILYTTGVSCSASGGSSTTICWQAIGK